MKFVETMFNTAMVAGIIGAGYMMGIGIITTAKGDTSEDCSLESAAKYDKGYEKGYESGGTDVVKMIHEACVEMRPITFVGDPNTYGCFSVTPEGPTVNPSVTGSIHAL